MQLGDFLHRLMFWIDTGNISKVERSTLYGTQRVIIAVHNITDSSGITLDRRRKLIFWLSQWNLIESKTIMATIEGKFFKEMESTFLDLLLSHLIYSPLTGGGYQAAFTD